jgi:RNA recognition motif-containing protein
MDEDTQLDAVEPVADQAAPAAKAATDPAAKIFVGNLAWGTTDDGLRQAFSQFGAVITAEVVREGHTGRSKGFGFVQMTTPDEANAAVEAMNGKPLDGRDLTVNIARSKSDAPAE